MTGLLSNAGVAGQVLHERLYSARVKLLGVELACCCSGLLHDFQLAEGGKSVRNLVETLTFRKSALAEAIAASANQAERWPAKETEIELWPAGASGALLLKLGPGGLLADGAVYRFMAYDRNYGA